MTTTRFRPSRDPAIRASDDVFSDPGKDWDGEATKLRPDAGTLGQGMVPDRRILARHENFLQNDIGRRLQNHDLIEVMNWPEPHPNTSAILDFSGAGAGNQPGTMTEWSPDPGNVLYAPLYAANGGQSIYRDDAGGYAWASDYTDASSSNWWIDSNRFNVACIATEAGAAKLVHRSRSAGWSQNGVSLTDARALVVDQDLAEAQTPESVFWIAGLSGATPRVIRASFGADGTSALSAVSYSAVAGTARLDSIAVGKGRGVAVIGTSSANGLYSFADGVASLTVVSHPQGGTPTPRSVVWDRENERFLLFYSDGRVFRSATGVAASWVGVSTFMPAVTRDYTLNGAVSRGSLVVVCGTANGTSCLYVTGDAGDTWDIVPSPMARYSTTSFMATSGSVLVSERVCRIGNRLAVLGYDASGKSFAAYSMRAGHR